MANATYFDFMDAVASYYGSGSDEWLRIAQMGVTPETLPLIQQIPGVSVTLSNSGNVLGYDLSNAFESSVNPIAVIDSNVQTGVYSNGAFNASIPGTAYTDPQTQETVFQSGVKTVSGGLTVAAVVDKLDLARLGVSLGTKLGKAIDSRIYSLNPEWWDEHYPTINPETWDTIASTETGKSVIRTIFGLQDDNTTMYMDERLLAYSYLMMLQNGFWDNGTIEPSETDLTIGSTLNIDDFTFMTVDEFANIMGVINTYPNQGNNKGVLCSYNSNSYMLRASWKANTDYNITNAPFTVISKGSYNKSWVINKTPNLPKTTGFFARNGRLYQIGSQDFATVTTARDGDGNYIVKAIMRNPPVGVTTNPNASIQLNPNNIINPTTQQPVTPNDNINDVLNALKTAYPDLFSNSVYEDVVQPDGTTDRITYVPTPFPDQDENGNPITDMTPDIDPQTNPEINPENRPSPYLQNFTDTVTTNPVTPDTGGGEASPIVTPTGTGSSLWAIYNPTQSEINSFGAWLWSSSFVEQIKKLFNDPMQAIIGVHKVFATPTTGGNANIKCGYIDSGVSAKTVTDQYSNVNCGSVNLNEYFGNVFDYDPYTKVEIFLPFIGIVPLDLDYIMRSKITVKYTVDVLSGACIANIKVTRDGYGSILFTYGGSAIVTYPISSGSYMGMVSGALSLIAGVAGTVASGGVLAPAMIGAASGIGRMKTNVQHSGQFSGACGAMGAKKPYLIISRPQTRVANNVNQFEGIPSNTNVQLSECTGFTKVKEVHLSIPGAYDSELQEIEELLKDGVII